VPIRRFKHKGLEALFATGSTKGVSVDLVARLRLALGRLQAAHEARDMDLPGLHLHELKGARRGTWAVRICGNWRLTFRLEDGEATDVDLEDYH
jgi:proteic killer suppression protein